MLPKPRVYFPTPQMRCISGLFTIVLLSVECARDAAKPGKYMIKKRWLKAKVVVLFLSAAWLAGCQQSEPLPPIPTDAAATASSSTAISLDTVDRLTAVAAWGEGQAKDIIVDAAAKHVAVIATSGIYVYDLATQKQLDYLPLGDVPADAALTLDGRFLAILNTQNNNILIWEIGSSPPNIRQLGSESPVRELRFANDGQTLLLNTQQGIVAQPWQAEEPPAMLHESSSLGWLSFTADGSLLAVPDLLKEPEQITIWSAEEAVTAQPAATLTSEPNMKLRFGRLSPDGAFYGGIVQDRLLEKEDLLFIWDVAEARLVHQLPVGFYQFFHSEHSWAFAPDGRFLAVTTPEQQVEIRDLAAGEITATVPTPPETVPTHVALTNTQAIVAYADGTLAIWDVADNAPVQQHLGGGNLLLELRLLPGDTGFVTVSSTGQIDFYTLPDGRHDHTNSAHMTGSITDVTFAPDSSTIAASFANGMVQLWQVSGELQQAFPASTGNIDSVRFSPDGRFLATGTAQRTGDIAFDDTVAVWQTTDTSLQSRTGGEQEDVPGCSVFRNNVVFTPDGSRIAAASHDFTVHLTRTDDGSEVHVFPRHTDAVLDIALSTDGRYLASASEDATVRVYDMTTYEQVHELTGSVGGFWSVAFSPDGRFLAAGNRFGEIYIWELPGGTLVRQIFGEQNTNSNLLFSPDGQMLAAAAKGGEIHFWSVTSGALLKALSGQTDFVQNIAFSPDGQYLISSGSDNILRLWQIGS